MLLPHLSASFSNLPPSILTRLEIAGLYKQHIIRQNHEVSLFLRDENLIIPSDINYNLLPGMSTEVRQKLIEVRPGTLVSFSLQLSDSTDSF